MTTKLSERRRFLTAAGAIVATGASGLNLVRAEDFAPTRTMRGGSNNYRSGAPICLLYTSPSPRDGLLSRMPSSA